MHDMASPYDGLELLEPLGLGGLMPPYWFRQRLQVASAISRWRSTREGLAVVEQPVALTKLTDDFLGVGFRNAATAQAQ